MSEKPLPDAVVEEFWRTYLVEGENDLERRQRQLFKFLPGNPRCKNCYAPFQGAGSIVTRSFFGKQPSKLNPQLCNVCEKLASEHQGGAEIELSLLFADVRGSTTIAERMNPTQYSQLINRFYSTSTEIMIHTNALIDKIIGDQVAGMYAPGIAGQDHPRQAIEAAQKILEETGHNSNEGPWIQLGVGVHTGTAFVGSLGSEQGTTDITVLGDAANIAARLSTNAGVGEILVSDAAYSSAGLDLGELEQRELELKGKSEPFSVWVIPS